MTSIGPRIAGLVLAAALMADIGAASAGPARPDDLSSPPMTSEAQYYAPGPYYGGRPVYRGAPYGYYGRRRWYNNHYGPGAAKERYRTDLQFCNNQPSRCR